MWHGQDAYCIIATKFVDFFAKKPEIEGLVVDRGHGDTWIALLLVEAVELLQKINLCTR